MSSEQAMPPDPTTDAAPRPSVAETSNDRLDLVIDDGDRYGGLRLISWWRQDRLAVARVMVVGAGALGNEVLKNLVLVGVGTIYLIDFDRVEMSNLARSVFFREQDADRPKAEVAALRARQLNPESNVIAITGDVITDVGLGLFRDSDVVIGCLDNREARLWVNRQCWKANRPWVDAGIQELQGVVKVFVPPNSACYECAMTSRDYQLINLRYSCPLLSREDIQQGKVPTAPTIASMMAALEVQEALKILHEMPVAGGTALVFNGQGNQFYATKLPYRDDCLSHETYGDPEPTGLGHASRADELFALARNSLVGPLALILDRDLVTEVVCGSCDARREVMRPRTKVRQSEAVCAQCGSASSVETAERVDESSPLAARALAELGVAPYDVVRVEGENATGFFLLDRDRVASPLDAQRRRQPGGAGM
jgi:adenylyltransferase/sulfurtransferase